MQTATDLISKYTAEVEKTTGLSLKDLEALEANTQYPVEKNKAIKNLINEVTTEINEQLLLNWLIENNIPDVIWDMYSYYDGAVYYDGQEVELND